MTTLPTELRHDAVIEHRDRSEPKFSCYQIVLRGEEIPHTYRPQWKDDWEILDATVERHNSEKRLRLTIIERYEDPYYQNLTLAAAMGVVAYVFLKLGDLLVAAGVIGQFAETAGAAIVVLALLPAAVLVIQSILNDRSGAYDAARP